MFPLSLFKQTVLENCALFLGRSVTNKLYTFFTDLGDTEEMALLKLDLIFRICDIGGHVK